MGRGVQFSLKGEHKTIILQDTVVRGILIQSSQNYSNRTFTTYIPWNTMFLEISQYLNTHS